jgi:restriction endonuclease S subunit
MNLLLIRADSKQCLPQYLYRLLNCAAGRRQTLRFAKKAINQVSINARDIKKMAFAIPGTDEQQQIVDLLTTADEQVSLLLKKRIALSKLKSALTQQLFSGRLRVK